MPLGRWIPRSARAQGVFPHDIQKRSRHRRNRGWNLRQIRQRHGTRHLAPETDPTNDFDYNGVGTHGTLFSGQLGTLLFSTFAEMERRLEHVIRVDMNVFDDVEFPDPPIPARDAPHLGLKRGGVAVDAGIRLPNVNDDFAAAAPDLGAYELDRPVPHYGPRPDGVDASFDSITSIVGVSAKTSGPKGRQSDAYSDLSAKSLGKPGIRVAPRASGSVDW